ncbi:hypothetical protein AX23_11395 [Brucella melitensis 548]|nr:hypothetical protein AX23_11395 [Brucella melitensis 548]
MRFAAIIHLYSLLRRHAFAEQGRGVAPGIAWLRRRRTGMETFPIPFWQEDAM